MQNDNTSKLLDLFIKGVSLIKVSTPYYINNLGKREVVGFTYNFWLAKSERFSE